MQTILVAGAGKSSIYLIEYLLNNASRNKWKVIVADGSKEAIEEKVKNHPCSEIAVIDITDSTQREPLVEQSDMVVSLMPPHLHIHLAKDCLKHKKNLITSSYISPEMKAMDADVKTAGLMFMCEMGLDPGIDHMTANQIIHSIERVASSITSFKSYCGGLIAPSSDNNPWHYKFSWNPKNIITAGADGAHYLQNGKEVTVPYEAMFDNCKKIKVDGLGNLAYYPNRDSLRYLDLYHVPEIKTFIRATLRYPAFCKGWQAIILLKLNDQKDSIDTANLSYADWVKQKTGYQSGSFESHIQNKLGDDGDSKTMEMLTWLGIFDDVKINQGNISSADILLNLLLQKWEMAPEDKDMVVMQHEVEYMHRGDKIKMTSTMVIEGESRDHSAMAKTVGLPMAILAKMVLTNKIVPPLGVLIPSMPSVYRPVLTELKHHGIEFIETVS
ncbi:MAG: saccharopine dehydrogenase NADP-binding domain-containing protein [Chitinophagales bacterium]|nr:saccharopine dehydrogenase NADP-binding domain-containing protein [Chitinophagales bacterium]